MIDFSQLRTKDLRVITLGSHPGIIQSILDYDFLIGREHPSVAAIIALGRKQERYFWGEDEVMIPVVPTLTALKDEVKDSCTAVLNVQSARRVLSSTIDAMNILPNLRAMVIFAEQTPEAHSLELRQIAEEKNILLAGPSSVGILLPGFAKIGAIGGTQHEQLVEANIAEAGDTAVISTSGGMVNELIHIVTATGRKISFAMALGGDRFPIIDPVAAMQLAEADEHTKQIVYFGELGGTDEYEIAQLMSEGKLTKKIIAYIAGEVAELFETPPQFGHAGAIAQTHDESASAKKQKLRECGAIVCDHLSDMSLAITDGVPSDYQPAERPAKLNRHKRSIVTHISGDKNNEVHLLGDELLKTIERNSLASLTLSMLLGRQVESEKAIAYMDYVMRLLVDHGPYVSGAVNTIVTARAGRDLVSGLTAGLLTIGPRFGGALNGATGGWLRGVNQNMSAKQYVDSFSAQGGIIPGIGHKRYRVDTPDPRVAALMQFTGNKNGDRYLNFARSIEAITTTKKGNLILNIDGAIGALMLDILESELDYSTDDLAELVDIEFFNALFVLSRSIGFAAHYLDQRRHDEGLFRLNQSDVRYMG